MTDSLQSKIIVGLFLFLGLVGVGYLFTAEQWSAYQSSKSQLSQKQAEEQQLKDALSQAENFVKEYESKGSDISLVNLALPPKDSDLSNLVATLGDLAKASGLALSNFRVDEVVPLSGEIRENSIITQMIRLDASGTYASFKDFLLRLQSSARIMDVDQIGAKADESGQVEYQITLRSYYQK